MAQENYVEGCSMQIPPSLEADKFCIWRTHFENETESLSTPDHLCLIGLTLPHGNNEFDCIVRAKRMGVNILKSIDEGPFLMGTVREPLAEGTEGGPHLGQERPRIYSDLSLKEKDRYNADIRETNILLQGLPKDIYTLINHYTDAKDIWDNVKILLEGSELTKEDWESYLYDDFKHFRQHKGETIHDYYVWFAKLINDMRNIKMTMSRMQLNLKFVNNMLPEWGRFMIAVKLNKELRDSNYDQLYAYLKQHETHANENKMMLEHFSQHTVDPLALMSNVSNQQRYSPSSSTSSSTHVPQHLADNAHLDSSQGMNPRGGGAAGYGGVRNRVGNANPGQARQAQENGVTLDAGQLLFLAGGQDNAFDDDVDEQPAPMAQTMFMANLLSTDLVTNEAGPSYDSYILSKYVKDNEVPVVHSNVSSVPNDAYMMIYNDMAENDKIKQHYKELYDSIEITRAKHIEQVTTLTTENVNLKAQILDKVNSVSKDRVKPKVLTRGKYAIDVEPIVPRLRNNREAHFDYLKHLMESVETIRGVVEKKQVTFTKPSDKSNSNTHKHVEKVNTQKTNVPVPPSTGVKRCTTASGSKPRSNTKKNRISPANSVNKMHVEEKSRINKYFLRTSNRVDSGSRLKRTVINSNSDSLCQTCN
nr:hypothetical protein [Tanacetum cinerariifolium]